MVDASKHSSADVAIIGAGASGLLLAAKLAERGLRVVVLEQGPPIGMPDLVSSQIWARRLLWPGAVENAGHNPVTYYAGWGTGGSATHHYAIWPRFKPDDFRMRSRFDRGLDWPLSYEDLRPWYDAVQAEVGIAGDASAEVWRPPGDPYPMPPLSSFRHAELAAEGFHKLGYRTAPAPAAINTVATGDRAACLYDNWCAAGCPIGALATPQATYLPRAVKAGADIRYHATVLRVLVAQNGERVTGVDYVDEAGVRTTLEASVVILAAFTAMNARLLLNSATERHRTGLGNASGMVGRGIMTHCLANVAALFEEDTNNFMGVPGGLAISQDDYGKSKRTGMFGSLTWVLGVAQKPNDVAGLAGARADLHGAELTTFMKTASRRLAKIQAMIEELPDPGNRIVLSDKTDAYGMPNARLIHTFGADAMRLFDYANLRGEEVWSRAGASSAWHNPHPATAHMAGGTMMGLDPASSVVDPFGRVHALANLFIAGGSVFPTEAAVPPTFTVYALASRTAHYISETWGQLLPH